MVGGFVDSFLPSPKSISLDFRSHKNHALNIMTGFPGIFRYNQRLPAVARFSLIPLNNNRCAATDIYK